MIYTGNNGRIYLARSAASGLQGTFTVQIPTGVGGIRSNDTFIVVNVVGDGSGAIVRIDRNINVGTTARTAIFTVVSAGQNYEAGDVVQFARTNGARITGNIGISAASTRGVDSEREILDDQYRIAKIRSWTLNSNSEVVETTALGDVVKTFSPSVTSGDGSATLMFYEDDITSAGVNRQKDIFELVDILFPRSAPPRIIMNLAVDGRTSGASGQVGGAALWKTNFLFHAYITSASIGVSYGEVVTVDTSFTVDGALLDVPWKPNVSRL
jgi:hypothetical protein